MAIASFIPLPIPPVFLLKSCQLHELMAIRNLVLVFLSNLSGLLVLFSLFFFLVVKTIRTDVLDCMKVSIA